MKLKISKKLIDVWGHSAVNFIAGCFPFKWSINSLSFSCPCSQRKKMYSMYLHHRYGFSSISIKISSSNSAINNIMYDGENFVTISVPCFCLKVFSLKVKILFLRTNSASVLMLRWWQVFPVLYLVNYAEQTESLYVEYYDIYQQLLQYRK